MQPNASPLRLLPVLLVLALLGGALYGGHVRLGWDLPVIEARLPGWHGALMVAGVFGTVIAAERAVALRANSRSRLAWGGFAPPLFSAVGAALLFTEAVEVGKMLIVLSSLGLVIVYAVVIYRQPTVFTVIMGAGAYMLLVGNALWATGEPVYRLVYWWMGFLVLTIVGERLELARMMRPSAWRQPLFYAAVALYAAGVVATYIDGDSGARLAGLGALALAGWLLHYDIARFTIRQTGLPRFIAACLLLGYGWLGAGGGLSLAYGEVVAGLQYDAVLHAVLLGFVFSMIFGHAPIIIPAVMKIAVPFTGRFYLHLALLHAGLALRVGSDVLGSWTGREWGGLINVLAVVLFLANTLVAIRLRPAAASTRATAAAPSTNRAR
jgi:hypothetical protein